MVSSTLCSAVHILGSQNVYGRAEGIAFFFLSVSVSFSFFVFVFPVIYCLRDIFSFSHRIKKVCMCTCMHVCTCACMHVCVSEVRGGATLDHTSDLMETSATLHTTMVCTAWKDHISRLCTEIIKIVKSATAVTDKGHSFMKVKPQIPCTADFCSKGTRQKRNPLTSSPNDYFCIYWL